MVKVKQASSMAAQERANFPQKTAEMKPESQTSDQ